MCDNKVSGHGVDELPFTEFVSSLNLAGYLNFIAFFVYFNFVHRSG